MTRSGKEPAKELLQKTLIGLLRKKSFYKISVNELCETARVSRSAFYANFEDKYQLLAFCLESTSKDLDQLILSHSPEDFFSIILEQIRKEHRLFYNVFGARLEDKTILILYRFFERHLSELLEQKLSQGAVLPKPLTVTYSYYIGGFAVTTAEWIRSGYKLPKETVADCLCQLMKDIIS